MGSIQVIKEVTGKYVCIRGERKRYIYRIERILIQTSIGRLVGVVWNKLWEALYGCGRKAQDSFSGVVLSSIGKA